MSATHGLCGMPRQGDALLRALSAALKSMMIHVAALVFLIAQGISGQALAQTYTNTVPFQNGFIGTYGTNINISENISYFDTLHISRVTFSQTGTSRAFTIQGNDIPGTLNFYMDDGSVYRVTGGFTWRFPSGNDIQGIGFLPTAESSVAVTTTTGANFVIKGAVAGVEKYTASNIGVYFIPNTYPDVALPLNPAYRALSDVFCP